MRLDKILSDSLNEALKSLYNYEASPSELIIQETRKEFAGDRTVVVFPFLKYSKKNPEETGIELGEMLVSSSGLVSGYNAINGFLNLEITFSFWLDWLKNEKHLIEDSPDDQIYMVEYSSPNTNKPLHLGHIRNNLLGYSVSEIFKSLQRNVVKVQVINDRGIHICKSMLAWQKYGNNDDPVTSGKKGDHLVGDYYVKFDHIHKAEIADAREAGMNKIKATAESPILVEAQKMLKKWEAGDPETIALWKKMNTWVYEGFDVTYKNLGVDFDKLYYESETYLIGKEEVLKGLEKGVFYQKEDSSVWVDLSEEGLDQKVLIRADGTSVYMTQDIGTAIMRFTDYPELKHLIYTVGNEQDYHFKVLFLILKKLGYDWADGCRHLSYGMVELPSGKMKSREGTAVDADDLMEEMFKTARAKSEELGKLDNVEKEDKENLYRIIGLGALKYFILKVDPRKQIVFNPEESIDFAGNTGPFIQYTHARIQTLLSKSKEENFEITEGIVHSDIEKNIIKELYLYNDILVQAAEDMNPALIANYVYELVRKYNQLYQNIPILKEDTLELRNFRLVLSLRVAERIKEAMKLLGIDVPDKM